MSPEIFEQDEELVKLQEQLCAAKQQVIDITIASVRRMVSLNIHMDEPVIAEFLMMGICSHMMDEVMNTFLPDDPNDFMEDALFPPTSNSIH